MNEQEISLKYNNDTAFIFMIYYSISSRHTWHSKVCFSRTKTFGLLFKISQNKVSTNRFFVCRDNFLLEAGSITTTSISQKKKKDMFLLFTGICLQDSYRLSIIMTKVSMSKAIQHIHIHCALARGVYRKDTYR